MAVAAPIIGNIALNLAIGVGASILSEVVRGATASKPALTSRGIRFEVAIGDQVPVSAVFGKSRAKGHLVFAQEYGDNNEYAKFVYAMGKGWWGSCDALLLDDKVAGLSGSNGDTHGKVVTDLVHEGTPHAWWKVYTGGAGQTADAGLVAAAPTRWTSAHTGVGTPYGILTIRQNPDLFGYQLPAVGSVWKGLRHYDWRRDDTKPGGEGDHRWADPATWEWTDNLYVLRHTYRRGVWINGVRVLGMGFSEYAQDLGYYTAAANLADEEIELGEWTGKRYAYGREISDDEEALQVLAEMDVAGCGSSFDRGGADAPLPAQEHVAVLSLADNDRIGGRPVQADLWGTVSRKRTAVHGQFVDASADWAPRPYGTQTDAALKALIGGDRLQPYNQLFESEGPRAQMRARIELRKQTYAATRTESFGPKALVLEPGDPFSRPMAEADWGTMLAVVEKIDPVVVDGVRLGATITWRQWHNTIIPANGGFVTAPPAIGAAPVAASRTLEVSDLAVTAYPHIVAGTTLPYARAAWAAITDPNVRQVVIRYWPVAGSDADDGESAAVDAPLLHHTKVFGPLPPETAITGYVIPVRKDGRTCTAVDFGFTSGSMVIGAENLDPTVADWVVTAGASIPALMDEIEERQEAIAGQRAERLVNVVTLGNEARAIREGLELATAKLLELGTAAEADTRRIERELGLRLGTSEGNYSELIQIVLTGSSSLVQRSEALQAGLLAEAGLREAAIQDVATAYAAADLVVAALATTLATQIRGAYAGNDVTLATGLLGQLHGIVSGNYDSLVASMASLAAGQQLGLDSAALWWFDATAEGWTGNGAPTIVGGYLRPADHVADPYVVSPDDLGIDGDRHKAVAFRLERTGTPAWDAYAWWQGPGDSTWDAGRREAIPEPTWDINDRATVIHDMPWTGEIRQIRLDFSAAQSNTDEVLADWIAIGTIGPGPSRANLDQLQQATTSLVAAEALARETLQVALIGAADPGTATLEDLAGGLVHAELQARVTQDGVLSAAIDVVSGQLNHPDTGLAALGTVQSSMSTQIDGVAGGLSALVERADDLDLAVDALDTGKAGLGITDAISGRIDAIGDDSIRVLSEGVRQMRSEIELTNAFVVERGTQQGRERTEIDRALADATRETRTRIDLTDDGLRLLGINVLVLTNRLNDPAGGMVALANLIELRRTEIVANTNSISSVSTATTNLSNQVNHGTTGLPATRASLLNDYYTKVQTDGVAASAAASSTSALSASLSPAVAGLLAALGGYTGAGAVGSAFAAQNVLIEAKADGGTVSALAESLEGVEVALGESTAGLKVRYAAELGEDDLVTYELELYSETLETFHRGGMRWVLDPATGYVSLEIDADDTTFNGRIDATEVLQEGTLVTELAAEEVWTVFRSASNAGSIQAAYNTWKDCATAVIPSKGKPTTIIAVCALDGTNNFAAPYIGFQIWRDGTALGTMLKMRADNANRDRPFAIAWTDPEPPEGDVAYKLRQFGIDTNSADGTTKSHNISAFQGFR